MRAGVHAREADMSFRDVTIKIPGPVDVTRDVSDVTHRKRGLRFEKSQLVEFLPRKKTVDFRGSPKPGQRPCGRCRTWWGVGRWKSQVYLSPYVEKPLNSKVIKSFVPELRNRVFCVSGFLCYTVYGYEYSMYISHVHVWVCYNDDDGGGGGL